ncbi:hypothetical protein MP228_006255 [Amoeboaphelidium protococcarum]|nr:hypothetical protein MP228_006255 [Amoeboaphelidium protococcarum]
MVKSIFLASIVCVFCVVSAIPVIDDKIYTFRNKGDNQEFKVSGARLKQLGKDNKLIEMADLTDQNSDGSSEQAIDLVHEANNFGPEHVSNVMKLVESKEDVIPPYNFDNGISSQLGNAYASDFYNLKIPDCHHQQCWDLVRKLFHYHSLQADLSKQVADELIKNVANSLNLFQPDDILGTDKLASIKIYIDYYSSGKVQIEYAHYGQSYKLIAEGSPFEQLKSQYYAIVTDRVQERLSNMFQGNDFQFKCGYSKVQKFVYLRLELEQNLQERVQNLVLGD